LPVATDPRRETVVDQPEIIGGIIIVVVAAVTLLARWTKIADPILLAIAGAVLGLLPGLPAVRVSPELLLLGVLPPLLFWHAFIVTPRELRANAAAIYLLSIGLVVATVGGVAAVAHTLTGIPWAVAFALGAIVSPTDPVAFLTVARRLGVSPRLIGLLDGENLANDATAIVLYLVAIEAAVSGDFSAWSTIEKFASSSSIGLLIGAAVGATASFINSKVDDPARAPVIALCAAYLAFLPAEALHVSAILAAGAAGLVMGSRSPVVDRPATRLSGYAFWETFVFLLTSVLFILIGLQLPVVLEGLVARPLAELATAAAAVVTAVVAIRLFWVLGITLAIPPLGRRLRIDGRPRPWREALVVGWSGMRGAVSLTVTLALPESFPERDIVLLLAYIVIAATLVGQGLTIPFLIRRLDIERDHVSQPETELGRRSLREAALRRIDELRLAKDVDDHSLDRARDRYTSPAHKLDSRLESELLAAEREILIRLRKSGAIGNDVLRELERELDMRSQLVSQTLR
jgi:Na+/H+ antiporter